MEERISITLSREELKNLMVEAMNEWNDNFNSVHVPERGSLLKIDAVCELLKVSRVTIHKWKKEGRIPYHRISNRIFFNKAEILEALESGDFNRNNKNKL